MLQPFRTFHLALVLTVVASFLQPLATPGASPVPDGTQVYVGHASHMTALIPQSWRVPIGHEADYAGDDGFVLSYGIANNGTGDACAAYTTSPNLFVENNALTELSTESTTWRDQPACELTGTANGMVRGLVVPLPESFDSFGTTIGYGVLVTDADHFDQIANTLDLTEDRLTPEAYLSSVIDIVEARAWWAPEVDWDVARTMLLSNINALQDYRLAVASIQSMLNLLRGQGDSHSFTTVPGELGDAHGTGMIVGGQQVLAVFPDSPADRAGLMRGDVIVELNGFPITGELRHEQFGQGGWPAESQLTVHRPGQSASFEVTITKGPYSTYLPPTGERLGDNLGYIEIDQFITMGRESDYAETGNTVIQTVDSPAVCGWIVDLRLNIGGGYAPMVSAVGSILGDGPFWGSVDREGTTSMVSYHDGAFVNGNGSVSPDYLAPGTRYMPEVTSPPVAVLTSSATNSSGEVATVAFVGRANTRLFGEQTAGSTVGNYTGYLFWDGTQLALAEDAYIDRNGTVYTDGVTPNVPVANDWATFRTPDDAVIAAASAWLQQQPGCTAPTASPPA